MAFEFYPVMSDAQLNSLIDSDARINIWHGSVRSSKTIMSIVRWIEYIQDSPKGKLLMIGKTERTLKRNILDVIEEIVGAANYHFSSGKGEVSIMGRAIDIVGANDERSENKIRGTTLAGAYGDELTLWPESFFKMLMTRLSVRGSKFFGTTNPDNPYHWLKTDYLDRESELNLKSFHFTLHDNPALDPEYVESLEKEYSGLWYKRFIQGLWVLAEGVVYSMFNPEQHTFNADELKDANGDDMHFDRYYVTVDYGAANPTVFLLIGERTNPDYTRDVYVLKEYYYNGRTEPIQKTNADYADDMVEFLEGTSVETIYIDPSAKSFILELRRRTEIVATIQEAINDVVDGIREVSSAITKGLLKVATRCTNILKEFGAYIWDAKAQRIGEDKPMKDNDHALDALRYYIFTRKAGGEFTVW